MVLAFSIFAPGSNTLLVISRVPLLPILKIIRSLIVVRFSNSWRFSMRTLGIVLLVFLLIGCGRKPVSYRDEIQPILNNRCVQCHGTEKAAGNVVLTSYDFVMNSKVTKWKKPIVVAGNVSESWLYLRSETTQPHFRMPPDTSSMMPVTEKEVELIGKWILQGAKNN